MYPKDIEDAITNLNDDAIAMKLYFSVDRAMYDATDYRYGWWELSCSHVISGDPRKTGIITSTGSKLLLKDNSVLRWVLQATHEGVLWAQDAKAVRSKWIDRIKIILVGFSSSAATAAALITVLTYFGE